jgi:glyoxylase-like metal-dependent hydrolase (beta-lactamase superfamily II)
MRKAIHNRRDIMSTNNVTLSRRSMLGAGAILGGAGAFSPFARPVPATAAESGDAAKLQGAGFYRFELGDFRATVVSDGYGPFPFWPTFAANAPESDVKPVLEANFMPPVIQATNNMLIVDSGHERILVDTGFGARLGSEFGHLGYLQKNLERAGIQPESIDVVIITHGHIDHIAGLVTESGALAFPNARFAIAAKEWEYWTGNHFESDVNGSPMSEALKAGTILAAKTNLPPLAPKVQLLNPDGEVAPGVHLVAAPGHSPAQSAILFTSGSQQFFHLADVAHNPVTGLQRPDWSTIFDYDSGLAIKTRRALLDRVATERALVMGYHFSFPAIGHVVRSGSAYRWEPTQWVW